VLIRCSDCDAPISDAATACLKCGRPITESDRRRAVDREREASEATNRVLWGCAALLFLGISCAAWAVHRHESDPAVIAQERAQRRATDAEFYCHEAVKRRLRAPATADFPHDETSVRATEDSLFAVSGAVDAVNGFGAKIRGSFACRMHIASASTDSAAWIIDRVTIH